MSSAPEAAPLLEALAREIAEACAAFVGETAGATRVDTEAEVGWIAGISCAGRLAGTITLGMPEPDGRRLSSLIMGMDEAPDDAVIDTIREVCGQAVGSLTQKPVGQGLTFTVGEVRQATTPGMTPDGAFEFTLGGTERSRVFLQAALVPAGRAQAIGGVSPPIGRAPVQPGPAAAAPAPTAPGPAARSISTQNLDVLLDIELPVSVRFGRTELPLVSLVRLGPGSVIDLRRTADEPVDVLVSGKVIARGEVVVVDGNYGVRVTEIVSTAERIRTIGA